MFVVRQTDVKEPAKRLAATFGSFKGVLDAPEAELLAVDSVGLAAVSLIAYVKQAATRYLQQTSRAEFFPEKPDHLIQSILHGGDGGSAE